MKCTNCGSKSLKDGFLSGEKGLLYYVDGKPGFKQQLLGKRKKIKLKVCNDCGHLELFAQ